MPRCKVPRLCQLLVVHVPIGLLMARGCRWIAELKSKHQHTKCRLQYALIRHRYSRQCPVATYQMLGARYQICYRVTSAKVISAGGETHLSYASRPLGTTKPLL